MVGFGRLGVGLVAALPAEHRQRLLCLKKGANIRVCDSSCRWGSVWRQTQ